MARVMSKSSVKTLVQTYWESHMRSRQKTIALDAWLNGKQYENSDNLDIDSPYWGRPYSPRDVDPEYEDLSSKSPTPWAGLVVKGLTQTAFIDGVRMPGSLDNLEVWRTWQQNRMDSKQAPIWRSAIGHGLSYGLVLPGKDPLLGGDMARIIPRSAKRMSAYYADDNDEWAILAIEATPYRTLEGKSGWNVTLHDETASHHLTVEGDGFDKDSWEYITYDEHPLGVTPVARCVNSLDLDGRATGEIEPVIPLLRRIDQDTFDRLIVQRYGAWKIRYIAGMAKPSTQQAANLQALALKVEDLLISDNPNTKFGTLDATDPKSFADLTDADLRMLSAVTQTPPHHLLGLSANLQAEALAAAEAGLQRKSADFKMHAGEFAEQILRMSAMIMGNRAEAQAYDMQVRWRDTESRSLTQAADALGKMAVQLKVPLEMLWERLPGWTDGDTTRAKNLVESGAFEQLLAELEANTGQQQQQQGDQQQGSTGGGGQ